MQLSVFERLRAGATLITAGHRLSRSLREEFDLLQQSQGSQAWQSPDILPLSAWLNRCREEALYAASAAPALPDDSPATDSRSPRFLLLNAEQERSVWERVLSESPEAESLLQIPATAAAAQEAWQLLHEWKLDAEDPAWQESADASAFLGWANRFRRLLHVEGWLTWAELPDVIAGSIRLSPAPLPESILLAGFDEVTPQQADLFDALRAAGVAVDTIPPPALDSPADAVTVALNDADHEIRCAARWARFLLETGETRNIGIVVPALNDFRPRIERTFREVLHPGSLLNPAPDARYAFNISLGTALAEYPMVRAALLILHACRAPLSVQEAGMLLHSPFLGGATREYSRRSLLDAHLRSLLEPEVPLDRLAQLAGPGEDGRPERHSCPNFAARLAPLLAARKDLDAERTPAAWAGVFRKLLKAAGWPGDRTFDSAAYQTLQAWNELLAEFGRMGLVTGPIRCPQALATLRRMAAERMFQPQSGDAPVQILGTLEASGLQFGRLWIMGLHDGAWPPPANPNPFVPIRLQRSRNLPHSSPARELEFARLITGRLLASAPEVIVSYPKREQDNELRPSPLIRGIQPVPPDSLALAPDYRPSDFLLASRAIEEIPDHHAPPIDTSEIQRGGSRIFQEQAACPFRAFARLRLGADPLDEVEAGLSALERGSLVHEVLEVLWGDLQSHERLCALPPEELAAKVESTIGQAIEARAEESPALRSPRFAAIESERLLSLILEWLEIEKDRAPFVVEKREHKEPITVGGIQLTIKADRIDRLVEDGSQVLIDYKTGEHNAKEWEGDRPDEPQLPLYALSAGVQTASAVAYALLKTGKLRFNGLIWKEKVLPGIKSTAEISWPEQVAGWKNVLERLAADYIAGRAEVDPKDPAKTCRYCELAGLCRISEAAPALIEIAMEAANA